MPRFAGEKREEDVTYILRTFKGLMLDADGVIFDDYETRVVDEGGKVSIAKRRYFPDGQGLSFLRGLGLKVVIASGEGHPLQSVVEKINQLPSVQCGDWAEVDLFTGELKKGGKVESLESWLKKHGLKWEECVYIGNDRTDVEAMQLAALTVVPNNAQRVAMGFTDVVLDRDGGHGAVREFAEMVLDARDINELTLPTA